MNTSVLSSHSVMNKLEPVSSTANQELFLTLEPPNIPLASELRTLSETHLLDQFDKLVRTERKITHLILKHIAEIDRRRLYLAKAYSSLFDYLTKGYGYSPGAAMRRIDGARILKEIPEVAEKIESGEIQLSQVSQLQRAVREVKKTEQRIITSDHKRSILQQMEKMSQRDSEKIIAQSLDLPVPSMAKAVVHRDESVTLTITLTKEQQEILKAVKESISHSVPSGNWTEVFMHLAERELTRRLGRKPKSIVADPSDGVHSVGPHPDGGQSCDLQPGDVQSEFVKPSAAISDLEKFDLAKFDVANVQRTQLRLASETKTPERSASTDQKRQAISALLRKTILHRKAHCQFRDPKTGRECRNRSFLQMDHVHSVSTGGGNSLENLQILCGAHNRWKYESMPKGSS